MATMEVHGRGSAARGAAIVLFAGVVVLFTGLGGPNLFNPDEPREAEMAREMLVSGDRVVPRLNEQPFLEKPPLFYWLVTAAYRLAGGPGETAARIVPALSGLGCVLLTWWLARDLMGPSAGVLAALVLLTAFEFFWIARRCMIDMPLTLAILVACIAFHRALIGQGRRQAVFLALGCAAIAAALLLKGVVGVGIPALAVLGWVASRSRWRAVLRTGVVAGGIAAFVPIGIWMVDLQGRLGGEAVREFTVVNNILRFTGGPAKGHDQPFWYYMPRMAADFAPWSLVIPFTIAAAFGAARRTAGAVRDLLAWFILPVGVLSLASTKRGIYLLPIYPAAAILVAWWLTRTEAGSSVARRAGLWLLFWGTVAVGATLAAAGVVRDVERPGGWVASGVAAVTLLVFLPTAWKAAHAGKGLRLGFCVAVAAAALELALVVMIVPGVVNAGASAREAGVTLRRLSEAGDRIAFYRFREGTVGGFAFYAGRSYPNLESEQHLLGHFQEVASGTPEAPCAGRALVFLRATDLEAAARALPYPLVEVRRFEFRARPGDPVGRSTYLLVGRSTTGPAG